MLQRCAIMVGSQTRRFMLKSSFYLTTSFNAETAKRSIRVVYESCLNENHV